MSIWIMILSFIIGIIFLLILVTVHEFAHFIIAKLVGIYVYEFAIGFGFKIFSWRRKETNYSIRIFPFGGYVYVASQLVDPPKGYENEYIFEKRKIENISKWKRLIFILSGSLMNFLIATFIFITIFVTLNYKPSDITYWGAKYDLNSTSYMALLTSGQKIDQDIVITDYWLGSNKEKLKIVKKYYDNKNDEKIKKNNILANHLGGIGILNKIPTYQTTVLNFIKNLKKQYVINNKSIYIIIAFVRVNNKKEVTINSNYNLFYTKPVKLLKTKYTYTIGISPPDRKFISIIQAFKYGIEESFKQSIKILKSFGSLFIGKWNQLSGPIGIAKMFSLILMEKKVFFFMYIAMLSINLFVLNLIPFPPLDGYKFFEILIELIINGIMLLSIVIFIWGKQYNLELQKKIFKKYWIKKQKLQLSHKIKTTINVIGTILFILLFIIITIKDIFLK